MYVRTVQLKCNLMLHVSRYELMYKWGSAQVPVMIFINPAQTYGACFDSSFLNNISLRLIIDYKTATGLLNFKCL